MKFGSRLKKVLVLCLVTVLGAAVLQGCGNDQSPERMLEAMKEFTTPDGTASIYLNKNWVEQDMGVDFWLCAGNNTGDKVCMMMQSPKTGVNMLVSTMDEMVELVEQSYGFSGEAAEAPEMPQLENITAFQGKISTQGMSVDAFVIYGETEYAYYALLFGADKMSNSFLASVQASCSKFQENAPEEVDNTTVELTDTVRWFNATYAVLTDLNNWDYNRFAGLPANEDSMALEKSSLEEWWSVTDRASADETLDWILTEGHRSDFAFDIETLKENGVGDVPAEERMAYIEDNFDLETEDCQFYADIYNMYEEYGETAIDGWDYCRAMNLMSFYYLAGYYTEQEALDKSLEIAQTMQPLFDSWDDLIESYMRGYEYWAEESADDRRAVYEDIKTRSDNPYALDYHTTLEKTW